MEEGLLPLLLFGSPGSGGNMGSNLLPLLLLSAQGSATGADDSCCCSSTETSPILAPQLAAQIARFKGCRVKLVLATSTLYPGGQLIIATIRDVLEDYVYIDHIEVNGVPSVDPSFLLLSTEQIYALQPIPFKDFLLETLWKAQSFRRRSCTLST